jgi:hypothetical protein
VTGPLRPITLNEWSCFNSYSLTGVSSAISGVESGCSPSPEPAAPNPYGDRSRRRRPLAGKAFPSDCDSNPAGSISGVATGVGDAKVSGDAAPVVRSALLGLGLAVMKDGSPDGAVASGGPSRVG